MPSEHVSFDQTAYGTPSFNKLKSHEVGGSTFKNTGAPHLNLTRHSSTGGGEGNDLDQKYTSIHMMDFENASDQMIEEEIET